MVHARRTSRSGLTLVELLITILIISILAAAVLGVAAVAGETARESRTQNMIARIHTLLMEHMESYKSRRVKVRSEVLESIFDPLRNVSSQQRNREAALARLYALREMMLMEMPQRWSDVLLAEVPGAPQHPWYLEARSFPSDPDYQANRTPLAQVYLRHYWRVAASVNKVTNEINTPEEILDNQGAECLYMIVMYACGDGEARTLFNESSIGDVDGDGAPEFLDGWGRPIEFLRWAPGFESEIQANANLLGIPYPAQVGQNPTWEAVSGSDHDPFDLFRSEVAAFRLVPLVISAGRDGQYGIQPPNYMLWVGAPNLNSLGTPTLSPYVPPTDPDDEYAGTKLDTTATDNIHNHLISTR